MVGRAALLGCVTAAVVLWVGCIGDDQTPVTVPVQTCSANGEPCAGDADCLSGFCDHDRCAEIGQKGKYGLECEHGHIGRGGWLNGKPVPITEYVQIGTEPPRPRAPRCDGYPCLSHRCRSCQSDADCEYIEAGPTCMSVAGWPGKRCGGQRPPPPPRDPSQEVLSIAPGPARPDTDPDICVKKPVKCQYVGFDLPPAPASVTPPPGQPPPPGYGSLPTPSPTPPTEGCYATLVCSRPPPCSR